MSTMYALGVDLGTTFTAAAVWRDGRAEVASLGSRSAAVPSVVLLRDDETVLTGEAASRRGVTEPQRVAREFKRRLGDTTPILLGGTPYSAEQLMARLLRSTLAEVEQREGGAPGQVFVCHPANWGPYKRELLDQAVRLSGIEAPVGFLTEPEAAAVFYAQQERIDPGALVAVYDLGGGTFDAAVLRKSGDGFEIMGQPEGIERLGGIDFDAAVFNHVREALGGKLDELDPEDPVTLAAVVRLQEECVEAKEALSSDTDASIPVLLPNVSTEVRITRAEFEAMVRPALHSSIEAMQRALRSAGVNAADLHSVLLVGGSSRMPLVAQLVGAELGRPVAVDAHPKHAIALGAAFGAGETLTGGAAASSAPPVSVPAAVGVPSAAALPAATTSSEGVAAMPVAAAVPPQTTSLPVAERPAPASAPAPPRSGSSRRIPVLVAAVAAVLLLGGGVAFGLLNSSGTDSDEVAGGGSGPVAADGEAGADESSTAEPEEPGDGDVSDGLEDSDLGHEADENVPEEQDAESAGEAPGAGPQALITAITDHGDHYAVEFDTPGYQPGLPGMHVHFFFDTVPPEQAGNPGSGPWILYGGPSPFTEYRPADRPEGATQLCALVANPDHSVELGSGNCVALPD
jgi:molecular chaperone DnaK